MSCVKKNGILLLALCGILALPSFGSASQHNNTVSVIDFNGEVVVVDDAGGKTDKLFQNMTLKQGYRIKTGKDSFLDIMFGGNKDNRVKIDENSDVAIMLDDKGVLELIDGEMYVILKDIGQGEEFAVKTPCAVCGARGTGWFMKTDSRNTEVSTFEHRVFVRGIKKNGVPMDEVFWIDAGYKRSIEKNQAPGKLQKLSKKRLSELKKKIFHKRPGKGFNPLDPVSRVFDIFGSGSKRYDKAGKRQRMIERSQRTNIRRNEELVERKQETRIEEKKDEGRSGSGSIDAN